MNKSEINTWGLGGGLGFKYVDFFYKSSDVCYIEIKIISSENTLFYLSYEILSLVLLNMVS